MPRPTDRALIRDLLAGDHDAARELVRRTRVTHIVEAVYRFIPAGQLTPSAFDALCDAIDHRKENA